MKKREQIFLSLFRSWCDFNKTKLPAFVFEAKNVKENCKFKISQLLDHQRNSLIKSTEKSNCLYYKIPDTDFTQKPFDGFFLKELKSYVVINFEKKGFVLINIKNIKDNLSFEDSKTLGDFFYIY